MFGNAKNMDSMMAFQEYQEMLAESLLKMQEKLQTLNMQSLFFSAIVALGILCIIFGRKCFQKTPGFIRGLNMLKSKQKPVALDLQTEVGELKKVMLQISEELAEIQMVPIKEQLSSLSHNLYSNFHTVLNRILPSLKECMELECTRNDQRFGRLRMLMEGFKEGFDEVRIILKKLDDRLPKFSVTEAGTQTERELLKKRQGLENDDTVGEHGLSRSIIKAIRKGLMEFLNETKLHMSMQKNEVMLDLKNILTQLSDDKDDLKNTIERAFFSANHQTQTSVQQFGNAGRNAMKCIAMLNKNTERTLVTKFQESNEKLQTITKLMKTISFALSRVKRTLGDSIDGQLDEIFKKLELVGQKKHNRSEDVVKSLQMTAREWNGKFSDLDEACKQLTCANHGIKGMLVKLDSALCNWSSVDTNMILYSTKNTQSFLNQSISMLELEPSNLLMTAQIYEDKLASMKDQIDDNTSRVQESVEVLLDEMRLLTDLVKNSLETMKDVNIKRSYSE